MKKIITIIILLYLVNNISAQTAACSPALFKDLRPDFYDSYPENFRELNGTLYFSTNDGLWKTNGSEVGTTLIESFSTLDDIEVLNNNLIFSVFSPNGQLWKSNGATTTIIKDFPKAIGFDCISELTPANGFVFFTVNENYVRKLWRTDGTEAGTILVKDIDPTNSSSYSPGGYFEFNKNIYFNAGNTTTGQELWKSDGTEAGTKIVKDIRSGGGSGHTKYGVYAILNNELYFYANDGLKGGLWKTDGSNAGTVFIKECYSISEISTINDVIYFSAFDVNGISGSSLYGEEIWRSDGTSTGTYMLKDINPGKNGSTHNGYQFKAINSTIVFCARDGNGNGLKLWKTDGTEAGTTLLKNTVPYLFSAKVFNGHLYFSGDDATASSKLWKTDGTEAGTTPVTTGSIVSSPSNFTVFNGNLFFTADTESTGIELWSCGAGSSSISNVLLKNNYKIYPNPTSGIVTISSTQAIASIDVFDVTGKLVYSQQNNNKQTNTSLDLSSLSNGIYFIHAQTENGGVSNSKVVVSK